LPSAANVRVLLVDDHPLVREGLRTYLALYTELEVVAEAASVPEALVYIQKSAVDLVLLDVQLGGQNGLSLLSALQEVERAPKVLVLTSFLDADYLREALRLGAAGYLLKRAGQGALLDGVRAALRGERALDPAAAALLPTLRDDPLRRLTARELEVLTLLAEGLSNKAVAKRLGVGEKTVKTHVSSVLAKLELKDRTQAALYAQGRKL
jgi:DNA-binding NarL/FixJ family response regulator